MPASPANVSSEGPDGALIEEWNHSESESTSITRAGDRQLWVIRGKNWSLPVYADPFDSAEKRRYWRLEPAIALEADMFEAMNGLLKVYQVQCASGCILSDESLREIAVKAEGITPSYYVKWTKRYANDTPPVESAEVESDPALESERFLRFVVERTGVASLATLKVIWRAFYASGLEWLVEKGRPIDLGYARLIPMPYRHNWKEIFLAMQPKAEEYLNQYKFSQQRLDSALGTINAKADLVHSALTAMHGHRQFIYWKLECVQTKAFEKAVEDNQQMRRGMMSPVQYTEYVRRQLSRYVHEAIKALIVWVRETRKPCGAVDNGRTFGSRVLRPWIPDGCVAPRHPKRPPVRIVSITEPILRGPSNKADAECEAAGLSAVPDLQLAPPDLRLESGPTISIPAEPKEAAGAEADGVRVPGSSESAEPG